MIETWPAGIAAAAQMWGLANLPLRTAVFRPACALIGSQDYEDGCRWQFRRTEGPPLIVAVNGDHVDVALLSVCWWGSEDLHFNHHGNEVSYGKELAAFDRAFDAALGAATAAAGAPVRQGRDLGKYRHRWALWRGFTGLFAVQQSTYDLQFGVDVNFWVTRRDDRSLDPTDPFIDWLSQPV